MAKDKDGYIELEGKVQEILPGGDFKVKLDNGHVVEARVSGKNAFEHDSYLPRRYCAYGSTYLRFNTRAYNL